MSFVMAVTTTGNAHTTGLQLRCYPLLLRVGPSASARSTSQRALRRDLAVAGRPQSPRPAKAGTPTRWRLVSLRSLAAAAGALDHDTRPPYAVHLVHISLLSATLGAAWLSILAASAAAALAFGPETKGQSAAPAAGFPIRFTDVSGAAGIRFRHTTAARSGRSTSPRRWAPGARSSTSTATAGRTCCSSNSRSWPGRPGAKRYARPLPNNRNGTFTDVTRAAGLGVEMYGMGVAAADYDNDGRRRHLPDRRRRATACSTTTARALHRRDREGRRRQRRLLDERRSGSTTTATARLDLFVANYVEWSSQTDLYCTLDGKTKSYCTPESYKGQSPTLYREPRRRHVRGRRRRRRASRRRRPRRSASRCSTTTATAGSTCSSPTTRSRTGSTATTANGTFKDVGMTAGVAFSEAGVARAGMGMDAGDYDGSGRPSLVIGNFSNEMMALYHNEGNGLFIDEAPASAIGKRVAAPLTFACFFFDYDLDGLLDIFAVQRTRRRRHREASSRRSGTRSRRTCSATWAARSSKTVSGRARARRSLAPVVGARRRLRRLRQRRRPRPGGHRQQRSGAPAAQRRREPNQRLRVDGRPAPRRTATASARGSRRRRWTGGSSGRIVKTGSSYVSQSELPLTFGLGARRR